MDYKEWISNRAEEIAQTQYDKSFYDLSKETAERIWKEAEDAYVDYYAALLDAQYEAFCERQADAHRETDLEDYEKTLAK